MNFRLLFGDELQLANDRSRALAPNLSSAIHFTGYFHAIKSPKIPSCNRNRHRSQRLGVARKEHSPLRSPG